MVRFHLKNKDIEQLLKGLTAWQGKKRLVILALPIVVVVFSNFSFANPGGGNVAAGNATISSNGDVVQINQSSNKAIINWNTFNIAPNETTQFVQPSSRAITLNRINPNNGASQIMGALKANGQVWLINPAGILFGAGASINVASLLATTANISNADFMAGNYHFLQSQRWHGGIVNEGKITVAANGMAALVAPGVENTGVIHATLGTVVLAAANEYTVDFYGDQLINFGLNSNVKTPAIDPSTGQVMKNAVSNSGKIIANKGDVLITAETVENIVDANINMSGIIEAKSATTENGEVVLLAENGDVTVTGKIIATGAKPGQSGGNVKISAKKVIINDKAEINVAGDAGGGTVVIGNNSTTDKVYIGPDAVINASALKKGNGGAVSIWSTQATEFEGTILASGGPLGGNGGAIETSSKGYIDATGSVIAKAPTGTAGSWLMDPGNVIIANRASTNGGFDNGTSTDTFSTTANSAVASAQTIEAALNAGTNVTIMTTPGGTQSGAIFVNAPITKTSGSTASLTLDATGNIIINSGNNISSLVGALNLSLISTGGEVLIKAGIDTNGGLLTVSQNGTTANIPSVNTVMPSESDIIALASSAPDVAAIIGFIPPTDSVLPVPNTSLQTKTHQKNHSDRINGNDCEDMGNIKVCMPQ